MIGTCRPSPAIKLNDVDIGVFHYLLSDLIEFTPTQSTGAKALYMSPVDLKSATEDATFPYDLDRTDIGLDVYDDDAPFCIIDGYLDLSATHSGRPTIRRRAILLGIIGADFSERVTPPSA